MATYSKLVFSNSTNGMGIKIGTTTPTGTLIHTAVAGTSDFDEIWLSCVNTTTGSVKLTVEWGSALAPDNHIEQTIPPESGLFPVVQGHPLQNSLTVRAYAGTANVLVAHGFVNRITA